MNSAAPILAQDDPNTGAAPPGPSKHIVDVLIEERAPRLAASRIWPVARPALYATLNYERARAMADAIQPMRGGDALRYISKLLEVKVEASGLDRVQREGSFLVLANHPTGIADGVAVYDALHPLRPDAMFYANSDAQRVCPRFDDVLIPVEWLPAKRTRERTRQTLKMTEDAIAAGKPIVIFPAGRIARMRQGQLVDREWMASAASLARKYKLPILPMHVSGPFAFWFHFFNGFSPELRDMTLFHELLNKRGKTFELICGPPIPHEHASGEATSAARRLKYYVENVLPNAPDIPFDPEGPECPWRDPPATGVAAGA